MTSAGASTVGVPRRPELVNLAAESKRWVLTRARSKGVRCPACGGRRFDVGDALFLGFLFANAGHQDYRIALTCRNKACPAPRTGITLRAGEFLLGR